MAGLTYDHLAMLAFPLPSNQVVSSFEKSTCVGFNWSYNNYTIRPSPLNSSLAQLTGKKDISGKCSDYTEKVPLWDYLAENNFASFYFESFFSSQYSFIEGNECSKEKKEFLKQASVMKMGKKPKDGQGRFFNTDQTINLKPGELAYDLSCQQGRCLNSFSENITHFVPEFLESSENSLLIIRDVSLYENMKSKNFLQALEVMKEIEKIYQVLLDFRENHPQLLVLVTGNTALPFEAPQSTKEWRQFFKKGGGVLYRKSGLTTPLFVNGPRAENFCGVFEESDIIRRISESPNTGKFKYYFVNPFYR